MRIKDITELKINNVSGVGNDEDVDYSGIKVQMTPSIFLKLTPPLPMSERDIKIVDYLIKHQDSPGFNSPHLKIEIPQEWIKGNFKKRARVVGHDGRHRMIAIKEIQGDIPIDVYLLFYKFRKQDVTPEMLEQINTITTSQSTLPVKGPLFKM